MANAHSCPILRLPDLAREHVVLLMNLREQYLIATLSKRAKRVAKNGVRLLSYSCEVMLCSHESSVLIQAHGTKQPLEIFISQYCDPAAAAVDPNRICSKGSFKEISSKLLPFLNDLFKIPSYNLELNGIPNKAIKDFWTSMKSLNIKIYKLRVQSHETEDYGMFRWVMENCRDVKRLTIACSNNDDIRWNSQIPFNFEYLSLRKAPWLTLDYLHRLFNDLKFFKVDDKEISMKSDDLNQLVNYWINNSKLEYFGAIVKGPINLNRILNDIQKQPVHRAHIENSLQTFTPGEAFKIQQKSGKEAVVCLLKVEFKNLYTFRITTHFNTSECDFWPKKADRLF